MALVDIKPYWWPIDARWASGDPTGEIGVTALTGSGHRFAWLLNPPRAGALQRVGFRLGSVTTAVDTLCRIVTIDSDVNPTTTLFATGAEVTIPSSSLTANAWIEAVLGTPPTVALTDEIAVDLSPTGTPNYQVANRLIRHLEGIWPLGRFFNGTSWTTGLPNTLILALQIDGVWVPVPNAYPVVSHQNVIFRSTTDPSEVGILLTPDRTRRTRGFRIGGFSFMSDPSTATVYLRAPDNSVVAQRGGYRGGMRLTLGSNASQLLGRWESPAVIEKGVTYRLTVAGTSGTDNVRLQFMRIPNTNYATAMHQGAGHYRTQRAGTGSWTETNTDYATMALEIDQEEEVIISRRSTYFA
jgi:hypothetical protein